MWCHPHRLPALHPQPVVVVVLWCWWWLPHSRLCWLASLLLTFHHQLCTTPPNTTPLPSCPHPSLPCCSLPSSSPTPTTTLLLVVVVLIVVDGNATVLDVTTSWRAHTTPHHRAAQCCAHHKHAQPHPIAQPTVHTTVPPAGHQHGLWCVVVMPTQPHRECSLVVVVGADCPKRVKHAVDAHANRGCRCAGSGAVEVHHHTAFVLLSNKCCGCVWCLLVVSCNNHTMPSTSWSCVPPPPTPDGSAQQTLEAMRVVCVCVCVCWALG